MHVRRTARVVLLDDRNRVLLLKVDGGDLRDRASNGRPPFWVTPGGRIEAGETIEKAATREIAEETGIACEGLGPIIWRGEQVLLWRDEPVRLQEQFVVARVKDCDIDTAGLSAEERRVVRDLRWWDIVSLRATEEVVLPRDLATLLEDYLRDGAGDRVRTIDLSFGD